jgi:hypothetical protein
VLPRGATINDIKSEAAAKDDADYLMPRRRHCPIDDPTGEAAKRSFAYLDSGHPLLGSAYDELNWTLGDAIKWAAERTREAVDGASVDEYAAQTALTELQEALERGELHLSGVTATNPIPQRFPRETWGTYQVCLEDDGTLLWPCVLHNANNREDSSMCACNVRTSLSAGRRTLIRRPCHPAPPPRKAPAAAG